MAVSSTSANDDVDCCAKPFKHDTSSASAVTLADNQRGNEPTGYQKPCVRHVGLSETFAVGRTETDRSGFHKPTLGLSKTSCLKLS